MSSTRYDVFLAVLMKRCFSSSLAVGRRRGSRWRQAATNSRKGLEKGASRVGGAFLGMRKRTCRSGRSGIGGSFKKKQRTFIGCNSASGGSPFAISMQVIPSDQMSALKSYPLCLMTSGDIQ